MKYGDGSGDTSWVQPNGDNRRILEQQDGDGAGAGLWVNSLKTIGDGNFEYHHYGAGFYLYGDWDEVQTWKR